jgi:hypothetical protein
LDDAGAGASHAKTRPIPSSLQNALATERIATWLGMKSPEKSGFTSGWAGILKAEPEATERMLDLVLVHCKTCVASATREPALTNKPGKALYKLPSLTMGILAIFLPPLYFLLKGRWIAFLVTLLFLVISIYLCITILLAPFLPLFWVAASLWAFLDFRFSARAHESGAPPPPAKT